MKLNHNSRRSFLANAAMLTAGFAIASPSQLFAQPAAIDDLKESWKNFCQTQNGQLFNQPMQLHDRALSFVCKGHHVYTGEIISFDAENIIAQPIWIYWGEKKTVPNDVIITFFSTNGKKLFRINRFELEGLQQLANDGGHVDLISLLQRERTAVLPKSEQRSLLVKTEIRNNHEVRINSFSGQHIFKIEKKLNYNA